MTKEIILLSFCACTSVFAQSEVEELKTLLAQQIKATQALQKRLEVLEHKQAKQETKQAKQETKHKTKQTSQIARNTKKIEALEAKQEVQSTPVPTSTAATYSQKSFLPDIALILDGSTVGRNMDNSMYESYYIPGFSTFDPLVENEIPFNKDRGFNFNYAELALHSTVGPYFDADAIFHLTADTFETEEAYITSRSLPYGLRAKAGKFRSEFGRINAIHQHAWYFTQEPLVFEALFGPEGINDAGVQLQWVLPTDDIYVMAGFEALQGSNDVSFGDTEKNNLYIGYLKSSFDLGDDTTVLAGASYLHGKNDLTKDTNIYAADLTVKTALDSYSSLLWQSELLYRDKSVVDAQEEQAGFYTQLIYQYNQNWSTGVRYDSLYKNLENEPDDLAMYSAVLEYKPFEFTKFRLQYTHDASKAFGTDDQRQNTNEIILEFTVEAGAHGAHAF